ncbi:MAG: hypothetical protein WCJ25_00825 [Candidatus Moraniibacteriota bacterium]
MTRMNAIPRLMDVGFDPETVSFLFRFSDRFLKTIQDDPLDKAVQAILKEHPELSLDFDSTSTLGMNGCLRFVRPSTFRYEIPCYYSGTEPCETCSGTGEDQFGSTCYRCYGKGARNMEDSHAGDSFSDFCMTLHILSKILFYSSFQYSRPTDNNGISFDSDTINNQQTMLLDVPEENGRDLAINGWLHDEIIRSARAFEESEIDEVGNAMMSIELKLFRTEDCRFVHEFGFHVENRNKGLFFLKVPQGCNHSVLELSDVPGNPWPWGKHLCPHNIDGMVSKAYLIAGLATIDRLARKRLAESNVRRQFALGL